MDSKTVEKVANLARLDIAKKDLEAFAPQLTRILEWVDQLQKVDTENVKPLANVVDITLHLREDEVTDGGIQKQVLKNAPETTQGFYVVPKVVE